MQAYINNRVEIPDDSALGEEFFLRVRLYQITDELIEVTAYGSDGPELLNGTRSCEVQFLDVRSVGKVV